MVLINLNTIFQKKFAITSVMNTYTKMCKLLVHPPDYYQLYIPLISK